jgi:DNA-binding NtrC family response regulator
VAPLGNGWFPMSVQAMKGGALEFLTKLFRDQHLLDAIQLGLSRDRARLKDEKSLTALKERFQSLSPREREIMIAARSPQQTNSRRFGYRRNYGEGSPQQGDAEDERPFSS